MHGSFIAIKRTFVFFPFIKSFAFSVGDDWIQKAALLYILKGRKPPLTLTWSTFHGFFVDDWVCESEVSAPKQRFWCHPSKMHVLPSVPLQAGYSEKCSTLLRGTFSLWASSSSDKTSTGNVSVSWLALCFPFTSSHWDLRRAQCVPVAEKTTSLVSPLTATLTFSSPLSFPLTPIYAASDLFSQKEMIAITFTLLLFFSILSPRLLLLPFSPLSLFSPSWSVPKLNKYG